MASGAAGPSSGQRHRELPGGWSQAPCRSSPGLRVVPPLGGTRGDGCLSRQDGEWLNPTQSSAGPRLTVPISVTGTPPELPDPQDQGVQSPALGSPCRRCQRHPSLDRSCWHGCGSGYPWIKQMPGGNRGFPVGPAVGTPQGARCWQDPCRTWHNSVTRATHGAAHSQHSCPGNAKPVPGTRTRHGAVPSALPDVPGSRGWDTRVQGNRSCRDMEGVCRAGGGTQGYGHKGLGTESETQVQGNGTRGAGMRRWRDTGAGTQGHGSAGSQGHLGTEDWDTGAGTQGCRDLCCSTTVSSMHHCSSPSQSLGNYELLPGSSVCPRNSTPWMGTSQQSDGHTQPQNLALKLLGSNCRC